MKVAVIDIGTNTFNLLIATKNGDNLEILHSEKDFVFLGKGGINKNILQEDAIERALVTFRKFKSTIDSFNVESIKAIATSAVRNAENGKIFTNRVLAETGIYIDIINGNTEAQYIFQGASRAIDFGNSPILLMDVGGGSTEFIIGNNKQIFWKQSFEVGAARLYERFHANDPITEDEIQNIENYLNDLLKPLFIEAQAYEIKQLIGSSGAFTSFAKIIEFEKGNEILLSKKSNYKFEIDEFVQSGEKLLKMKLEERLLVKGLIQERAPMITVGIILVRFIIQKLNIEGFSLARYALKEGVAFEALNSNNS